MILKIDNYSINVIFDQKELLSKYPIAFLHGFTGDSREWEFIKTNLDNNYSPICIDLLGHGNSSKPNNPNEYSSVNQVKLLEKIFDRLNLQELVLAGYSMGGRLAISYALKNEKKILGLILESTSFGIEEEEERKIRLRNDEEIAKKIMEMSEDQFLEYWYHQPVFNSFKMLPRKKNDEFIQSKKKLYSKIGFSNSLIGFSTGSMEYQLPKIKNFNKPILLLCGKLDSKYVATLSHANDILPNSELKIIENCGHNVHLENPVEFLKFLNRFLSNIREK